MFKRDFSAWRWDSGMGPFRMSPDKDEAVAPFDFPLGSR